MHSALYYIVNFQIMLILILRYVGAIVNSSAVTITILNTKEMNCGDHDLLILKLVISFIFLAHIHVSSFASMKKLSSN